MQAFAFFPLTSLMSIDGGDRLPPDESACSPPNPQNFEMLFIVSRLAAFTFRANIYICRYTYV